MADGASEATRDAVRALQELAGSPGWSRLADRYYCRQHLYDMPWDPAADFARHRLAGAPDGGALALVREEQAGGARARVQLRSASGRPIGSVALGSSRLAGLGWLDGERCAAVSEDGVVSILSVRGATLAQHALSEKLRAEGIYACEVLRSGVVLLTRRFRFHFLPCVEMSARGGTAAGAGAGGGGGGGGGPGGGGGMGGAADERPLLAEPVARALADARLEGPPRCFVAIDPSQAASGAPEVLLGTQSGTVLTITRAGITDLLLTSGPFCAMALSADARLLALVSEPGGADAAVLRVLPVADPSRTLTTCRLGSGAPPPQLCWCASDSVVACLADGSLLMVGPAGDTVRWSAPASTPPPRLHLLREEDGVRLIGPRAAEMQSREMQSREMLSHEMLSRVEQPTAAVLRPGSLHPAARLLEASEAQRAGDALHCLALVRALGAGVREAATTCVHAALAAHAPPLQLALLRAAALGRAAPLLDDESGAERLGPAAADELELLPRAARTLRTLNAVREPSVGLALTHARLRAAGGVRALVGRLLARWEHLLAARVCDAHGLSRAPVVEHWAASRIEHAVAAEGGGGGAAAAAAAADADAALLRALLPRLQTLPEVSFANVAAVAHAHGRAGLAARLLHFELRPHQQVPLLLQLSDVPAALGRACASHDPDLISLCVLHAEAALAPAELCRLVGAHRQASALLSAHYARTGAHARLAQLHEQLGRSEDAARLALRRAYAAPTAAERARRLGGAVAALSRERALAPDARAAEEALALFQIQVDLERVTAGQEPDDSAAGGPYCAPSRAGLGGAFAAGGVGADGGGADGGGGGGGGAAARRSQFKFVDRSLSETLFACFLYRQAKRAAKLRSEFKVPDRRFWHIKIAALAHMHDWEGLDEFSRERKHPPGGFAPFVDACLEQSEPSHARRYVERLTSAHERVGYLMRMGLPQEAREVAVQAKDAELLERIARNMI